MIVSIHGFISSVGHLVIFGKSTGLLDETDSQNLLDQSVGPVGETLVNVLQTFVKEEPTFEQFNTEVPGLVEGVEEALEELAQTTQVSRIFK